MNGARPGGRGRLLGALVAGALGAAASVAGAITAPAAFFPAYLVAWVYWLSLALGCLGLTMLCHLARSRWALASVRYFEAGASTLPLLAVLFVPLALGVRWLYPWTNLAVVAGDPLLAHKFPYLNLTFFFIRAFVYFALWLGLTWMLLRRMRGWTGSDDPRDLARVQRVSALGLVLLGLSASFAAIDWLMSLEPHWYSTIYGTLAAMGGVVGAFALGTLLTALDARRPSLRARVTPRVLNDLGSLLLACVLLWAYLAYSQYLVIWSGNLPEEVVWYVRRLAGEWRLFVLALIAAQFALPVLLLAVRDLKRSAPLLAATALLVVSSRYLDVYWLVKPALGAGLHWLDAALMLGLGGFWAANLAWSLARAPLAHSVSERAREQETAHAPV